MVTKLLFLVLLSAFLAADPDLRCPIGWVKGPLRNCYKFVNSPKASWSEAQRLCANMGGILAHLNSQLEISWIRDYRRRLIRLQDTFWIGGYKRNGEWLWKGDIHNFIMAATDWIPGQPDNSGGKEDCLQVVGLQPITENDYRWNDNNCSKGYAFICESQAF